MSYKIPADISGSIFFFTGDVGSRVGRREDLCYMCITKIE